MSQENVDSIRAAYEAFNRRDYDGVLGDAHPDFEIRPLPALAAMAGGVRIRGHDKAKKFWSSFFEGFDEIQVEPRELLDVGEMVVADVRKVQRSA